MGAYLHTVIYPLYSCHLEITIGNIAFISAFLEFVVKSFLYGSMALGLIMILIVIGRPIKTRNTENKLREIGLTNHRGNVPTPCSFKRGNDKKDMKKYGFPYKWNS